MNTKTIAAGWLLCAAMYCTAAAAQIPSPASMKMKPMPTPVDAQAIPLYPGVAPGSENSKQKEQWSDVMGDHVARNVVRPTITPFLPAKGKATGAAIVVAPGGGFMVLSMENEGIQVARWLADHGIAAFVLKYRLKETPTDDAEMDAHMARTIGAPPPPGAERPLPTAPLAFDDAQEALRIVRKRAAEWSIDPKRIGMIGFSAGALTTLQTALRNDPTARPDFIGTIYGSLATVKVPANAPPLFCAIAADDPLIGHSGFGLIAAWRDAKAPVEFHYYEHGGHGFGMRHQSTSSDMWADEFLGWMKARGLLGS